MDNNPNSVQQPDQDTPVFRSSDLTQTKARKDTQYFTNVHKATLGQKLSDWFHKVNRESLEHSAARKAALKAKLAERQRAADLASISLPTTPARPRSSTSFPTTTPPTPAPAPAAPTTPTPAPTVIIETPSRPPRKSRRTLFIIIATAIIIVIAIVVTLLVLKPWAAPATSTPPSSDSPDRYALYQERGAAGIDEYYAAELAEASDTQARNSVLAQKIAFYSLVFNLDAALEVMEQIDFDSIASLDLYIVYMSMSTMYAEVGDDATAATYYSQAMDIPGLEEYKLGGN